MVRAKRWGQWFWVLGELAACSGAAQSAEQAPPVVAAATTSANGAEANNGTAARAAFKQGVAAYDAGRFQDALVEFKTASSLGAPEVHFNLAETHRALEQFPEAIGEYEEFLAERSAGAPYSAEARSAVAELEARVAHLEVIADRGAELFIDGKAHPLRETGHPLRLMPGLHWVRVSQQGRIPFVRSLLLAAGDRTSLPVTLATSDVAGPPSVIAAPPAKDATPPQSAARPRKPFYRSPWFLSAAGAVLLGAAAASVWAAWPHHCETGGDVVHCTNL